MTLTYPRAGQLSVGFDPHEDRMFLIFHLQDGGFRKAFLSRRMLGALFGRMSEELAASHPMAGYTAQRDEMLQMEHVASLSAGTGKTGQPQTPQTKQTQQAQPLPTEFPGAYYVTSANLEVQESFLIIGFSGEWLIDPKALPVPIAALGLARSEAHLVLRLLRDKAELAGWNMEIPVLWMKPLEYGKALGAH